VNDETDNSGTEERPKFSLPTDLIGHIHTPPATSVPIKRRRQVSLEGTLGSRVEASNYRGAGRENGHWDYPETLGTASYVGFIYVIKDVVNSKLYLGKKSFRGSGVLNKGQKSNWPWYISSSKELSESVKMNGKDNFEFIAIEQYATKGGLSYAETWSLCHVHALVHKEKWYNGMIGEISWKIREPPTQRHIERLHNVMDSVNAVY
jgi:hypothetical protein